MIDTPEFSIRWRLSQPGMHWGLRLSSDFLIAARNQSVIRQSVNVDVSSSRQIERTRARPIVDRDHGRQGKWTPRVLNVMHYYVHGICLRRPLIPASCEKEREMELRGYVNDPAGREQLLSEG
jgi:hypothetical protein